MKAGADKDDAQAMPATAEPNGQALVWGRSQGGRWKLARNEGLKSRTPGGNAGRGEGLLENKIELGAGTISENGVVAAGFDPQANGRGETIDGPAGEGAGREVAHEAGDQQHDNTEPDGVAEIGFGAHAETAPEG